MLEKDETRERSSRSVENIRLLPEMRRRHFSVGLRKEKIGFWFTDHGTSRPTCKIIVIIIIIMQFSRYLS